MNILDLLQKHGITARKVGNQNGGEFHSRCPRCGGGEKDHSGQSDRFLAFPEQGSHGSWYCRGCGVGGDAIEFLKQFDGLNYLAACELLQVQPAEHSGNIQPRQHQQRQYQPRQVEDPAGSWQLKAGDLVRYAHAQLLDNQGQLDWLAGRGITMETVRRMMLGWHPGENGKPHAYRSRRAWGLPEKERGKSADALWIPRGLVIPQIIARRIARIRIRRPEADREKFLADRSYHVMPGSGQAPLLFYRGQRVVVVVEAELDAGLVYQEAGDLAGVVAMGNSTAKPDAASHQALERAELILVALDADLPDQQGLRAGGQAWQWWQKTYRHAIRWPVPVGKDPGEAYRDGLNIRSWVSEPLPPAWLEDVAFRPAGGEEGQPVTAEKSLPPAAAGAGLLALADLLRENPSLSIDRSHGGVKINYHQNWAKQFPERYHRFSQLVFWDKAVFGYLLDHPAQVVGSDNLF